MLHVLYTTCHVPVSHKASYLYNASSGAVQDSVANSSRRSKSKEGFYDMCAMFMLRHTVQPAMSKRVGPVGERPAAMAAAAPAPHEQIRDT